MSLEQIDRIQGAIRRWNPWWIIEWKISNYVNREIKSKFDLILALRHVKDIIGVRRCGKTTFMTKIINEWIMSGIDAQNILLINCDDYILKEADFESILTAIHMINPRVSHLILDEIQEKPRWESWVRTLYDTNQFIQIVVSGSNSSLLSDDLGRLLTGRHISTIITPYSYREYLWSKGWTELSPATVKSRIDELQYQLEQYFIEGGFPEVISKTSTYEKNQILLQLANDIISRDILSHYDIDPIKIKHVFQYAMANFTREYSLRKIGQSLKIHPDTVDLYLGYLSKCFAIAILPIFAYKLRTQFHENKKIYVIDTGLRNTVSFHMGNEKGKYAENVVFWELYRQKKEVYYWKDQKHEVDFVIANGMDVIQLIQVCWSLDDPNIVKREKDGLVMAAKQFKKSEGILITAFNQYDEIEEGIIIHVIRLVEWLLLT